MTEYKPSTPSIKAVIVPIPPRLQEAIANLSKPTNNAVNLTTIHGAKGLESHRVFHLRPDLVPHPRAEKDWEQQQEKNLYFVALTRAKQDLFFAR